MTNYGLIEISDVPPPLVDPVGKRRIFQRQTSVILAKSGERVQRHVTISNILTPRPSNSEFDTLLPRSLQENHSMLNSVKKWLFLYIYIPLISGYYNIIVRLVLKSSIAYLIASMAVYFTPFNEILGKTDSKHVVATVAVYFHPSRSIGSMHQTAMFVIVCIIYSFTVTLLSRAISAYFFVGGEDELSHGIDLIVSSISLGVVAYFKQKINMATFDTACSLASITIVSLLVREGTLNSGSIPFDKFFASIKVIASGVIISISCCYLIWPVRAVKQLRNSLNDSYNIMSSILSMLATSFLTGEKLSNPALFVALKSNISQLQSDIVEAKFELGFTGREKEWNVLNDLVKTTIALARHIQALRSSVDMQYNLLNNTDDSDSNSSFSLNSYPSEILRVSQSVENLANIHSYSDGNDLVQNSVQLFDLFVFYLAPSIKSFIFTIKGILSEVPFEKYRPDSPAKFAETKSLQQSLTTAIELFQTKQADSFSRLYDQDIFKQEANFIFKADQEEVAACCGNFVSILALYADELNKFLIITETYEDARSGSRSWEWIKFWKKNNNKNTETFNNSNETLNAAIVELRTQYRGRSSNDTNTESISYKIWKALKAFRRVDVQFGIRVGLGAFGMSIFAFLPQTKPIFLNWRGEWSVTIFCIMMNKSIGGTNRTVKWRLLGTFLGALVAYFVWIITNANVYALTIIGFLISIPSFFIILFWKQNNAYGRFILLAYNLTALYSYSMIQHDSEDDNEGGDSPIIAEIAIHRFIAVSVGIFCALTMAALFLPNSARSRLKRGITLLWLRLGVIWNSDPLDYSDMEGEEGKLIGLKGLEGVSGLLQECETLLKQAPLEFRLKGEYPVLKYEKLLKSTSRIINAYQNMNLMIKVDPMLNVNEEYLLKYLENERSEVENRLFLMFYTIASAMKLGIPLPNKPASPEHAKDRMLGKLSEIRSKMTKSPDLIVSNEDFILLYSYILVTTTISEELDLISLQVKELLGNISEESLQLV